MFLVFVFAFLFAQTVPSDAPLVVFLISAAVGALVGYDIDSRLERKR